MQLFKTTLVYTNVLYTLILVYTNYYKLQHPYVSTQGILKFYGYIKHQCQQGPCK